METKRGKIVAKIFENLAVAGEIIVVAMEPRMTLGKALFRYEQNRIGRGDNAATKKEIRKYNNIFYYLKKKELIETKYRGNQMYISLTEKGQKKASKYKINDLKIKTQKDWDKKWWVLIFDIEDKHRSKREALRGKIKELGLYQLQKSVWVCPYEFKNEMDLLRDFFGLESKAMKVITASEIEDDKPIRDFFGLE